MEIESLRLDFHVYSNRKSSLRDLVSNWGFSKLTSSSLLHLSHFHSHSRSHPLTLTQTRALSLSHPQSYIFISHTHKTLSFSLYLSHGLSHSHTLTHTQNPAGVDEQSPAQPSNDADEAEPSHRLLSSSISLSLTRRSFLLFSLSLITTPIPIPILVGKFFI